MTIINVLARNCTVSKSNVRRIQNESANTELRTSIIARGLLQNLVGFAVPRKKGHYEITAGGRRITQTLAAIDAGELPATYEVPIMVMTDKENASEVSLAENFTRLQMNPAEECIAFKHLVETEGKTATDIAKRFGLTERFVLGRLRLANLADVVFTALQDGEITLDVAMAYAATCDADQQARVYAELGGDAHPNTIRRHVTTIGYRGSSAKVKLIPREEYAAAGGHFDGDLFSDEENESWLDTDIVDRLAAEKLAEVAEATRTQHGYAEIRVVNGVHEIWAAQRDLQPIVVAAPPLSDEANARLAEITSAIDEIESNANDPDGDFSDADNDRYEGLQSEYEAISNSAPALTDEQKSTAIGFVYLGNDGTPYLHHELFTPAIAPSTTEGEGGSSPCGTSTPTSGGSPQLDTIMPVSPAEIEKSGVSQRLAAELAIQKTELVALHVANDPHFALDLGVFVMADRALGDDYQMRFGIGLWAGNDLPTELRASQPQSPAPDFKSGTQATEAMAQLYDGLDKSWYQSKDASERFDAFRQISDDAKAAWLGWTIARTLRPVEAGKAGAPFIDHIGTTLGIDVAAWWRPTATNYFDRVSKTMTLDAIQEVGGPELKSRYASSKKAELAASAEKLFRGETIVEQVRRPAILAWVPPAMRLGSGANPAEPDAHGDDLDNDHRDGSADMQVDQIDAETSATTDNRQDDLDDTAEFLAEAA